MEDPATFSKAARLVVVAASFVVVVAGMKAASAILVPLLLALFIALLSLPAVRWMHRHRVPDALAVPLVLLLTLAIGAGILAILTFSMDDFAGRISFYTERVGTMLGPIREWLRGRLDAPPSSDGWRALDPSRVLGFVKGALGQLSGLLGNLALIALLVVFLLAELLALPRKLEAMRADADDRGQFDRIVRSVNRYITIKGFVSLVTGGLVVLMCLAAGVPFALLWGLLAFLLNFIPNIGSILAAVPPVLVALLEPELGPGSALVVALGFVAVNVIVGNVVEPRLMGRSLDLSTLVVFVSMVFWGWVFGAVGMFLSVPLTMVLKIALESSDATRPIAILLGSPPAPERAGS